MEIALHIKSESIGSNTNSWTPCKSCCKFFLYYDPHTYMENNGVLVERTKNKVISKGILTTLMFYDRSDHILTNGDLMKHREL